MKPVLQTRRLDLRRLCGADAAAMLELNADAEVLRYTGDPPFQTEDEAERFLIDYQEQYARNDFGRWAVIQRSDDEFLGWCGLKRTPREGVDLGFRLLRRHWGNGYATEASQACVVHAFDHYRLPFLLGRAVAENAASLRVLEKLGFEPWLKTTGHGYDDVRYLILPGPGEDRVPEDSTVLLRHRGLHVRVLAAEDQLRVFLLEGNPNVLRYADGELVDHEGAGEIIARHRGAAESRDAPLRVLAVADARNRLLGTVATVREGPEPGIEMGYRLLESCWGRGLGSTLGHLALEFARSEYPEETVFAMCDPRNAASLAVLGRLEADRRTETGEGVRFEWLPG